MARATYALRHAISDSGGIPQAASTAACGLVHGGFSAEWALQALRAIWAVVAILAGCAELGIDLLYILTRLARTHAAGGIHCVIRAGW